MVTDVKEVREGYKMTELGEIPEEWDVKKQGEVSTFYNGRAYKQTEFKNAGTPIVRIQNLTGMREPVYSDLVLPDEKYIENGDLIYAWSATFGPYIWKGPRSIYHYHIWKVEVNPQVLNKNFYFYRLDYISNEMHSQKNGSAFSHITKGGMENHKIALPPIEEQQKIAEILSTVDETIETTEQLLEKKKELKKGLMQQLLTKGIGHTNLVKTIIGEIPESWSVLEIQDIAVKVTDGEHKTPARTTSGELLLSARNIKNGMLDLSKVDYVSKEELEKITKRCHPEEDDILISCSGTVGRVCVVPNIPKFGLVRSVALVKVDKSTTNSSFLMYALQSPNLQKQMKLNQSQLAQANLFLRDINKLKIPFPTFEEQKKIAQILSSIDEQIKCYENEKERLQEIKKGLMQQLLTGKIRVTV